MKSEADGDVVLDRQPRISSQEVMCMFAGLTLLLLQDALFLLGYLARGTAFPKPLGREEEARMIEHMQAGDGEARASLLSITFGLPRISPENTPCRAMTRMT